MLKGRREALGATRRKLLGAALVAALVAGVLSGLESASHAATGQAASSKQSLTVLENQSLYGTWSSLDPVGGFASADYLDAIYGVLFYQGLHGKVIPDLATGYKFINGGMSVEIFIRPGVVFQDGTPFNAQAVAFNINRDLEPQNSCLCRQEMPVASVTTPNDTTVVLNLTHVYSPIIEAFFQDTPNYMVSPTALQKMGETAFGMKPVGAGPFEVVSDQPNYRIVLKRNPTYWHKGQPHLESLTFQTIGSDESAYDALISGQAQVYEIYTSYASIPSVSKKVNVPAQPAEYGPFVVRLNTTKPPFNNILAREAIYYATNPKPIDRGVAANQGTVTQSLSAPGALYQETTVPGYRTYNPKKAKALVKQLGGLSVGLFTLTDPGEELTAEALKAEWDSVGIKTTLTTGTGVNIEQDLQSNNWEAELGRYGGSDPALFTGLPVLTAQGLHDPKLDQMTAQATSTLNKAQQAAIWRTIYRYLSDQAYLPILFAVPFYPLVAHGVSGAGLTTPQYQASWETVSVK